ncbi:uncharacterized protein BX664DRAFT_46582 [Halteromyces radiatus]|uniref:uncharacterized protein n=1 Tax=Halteromyces radiatus TaxID=101107 RepID=UPI002220A925|nr:uncharacterized protein BX664DRAFT_46582 [Halteromyces radiatus]KAI8076761.1 hypothetical protein BX664DRAFT_46582 [Halteromyces radiatus]
MDSDNERQSNIEIKALPSDPPAMNLNGEQHSPQQQQSESNPSIHDQQEMRSISSHQPQQSEAMVFAMQAVENMLQDDTMMNTENHDPPVTLSEHKLSPQQLPAIQSYDNTLETSKPPTTPQPAVLATLADTKRPSSVQSIDSNQIRFKPVPNPAFSRKNDSTVLNDPPATDNSIKKEQQQQISSSDDNDHQLAELISTAALVAAGNDDDNQQSDIAKKEDDAIKDEVVNNKNITKSNDDPINLTDDESEDSYKLPVRTPPKDEKWVISSIRRPQMVPVRSTNARVYDGTTNSRGSMIRSSAIIDANVEQTQQSTSDQHLPQQQQQQQPSPEANVTGKLNRPHPPLKIDIPNKNETKAAAQEAIAAGRAHTQHHSQSASQQNHTQSSNFQHHSQQQQQQQQQPTTTTTTATTT